MVCVAVHSMADARLIAAAPEMLAFIKVIAETSLAEYIRAAARDLLAKVEGKG